VVYSLSSLVGDTAGVLDVCGRLASTGAHLVTLKEGLDTTSNDGKSAFRLASMISELGIIFPGRRAYGESRPRSWTRIIPPRIPFGFDLAKGGGVLLENHTEQKIIRLMRSLRAQGLSLRTIASELDSRGIRPKYGKFWSAKAVSSILNRRIVRRDRNKKANASQD
jgi:hypothetical protein